MILEKDIKEHTMSIVSDRAAFKYSSDKGSLKDAVLDGKHQITPISGVQFYLANGGNVVNIDRSSDW
jgi:hypothetical protein